MAPVLPAMQNALALSDAQVALFTSVYLVPSVLLAFPAGVLTERVGRREMYVLCMTLFGLGGLVQVALPTWPVILGTRAVQGAAFGVVLALSITMIGDVLQGNAQVRAHGQRIVAMSAAEALFPTAAGIIAGITWYAPFGMQALALVLGVAGWFLLPRAAPARHTGNPATTRPADPLPAWGQVRRFTSALTGPAAAALQVLAFLRFFFKFALVTFYPLLAVNERHMSVFTVGLVLGASALLGTASAALTGRTVRRIPVSRLLTASLVGIGASLLLLATVPTTWAMVAGITVYGVADGQYSVATNALVTVVAPPGSRAAFVAFTGTVRNLGKLVAPLAFGALTLALPVAVSFAVWGSVGVAAAMLPRATRRFDRVLSG